MSNDQRSRRHHYAPQFCLRPWVTCADNRVWQYTRPASGEITAKRVSPKATAFRNDLYAVENVGITFPVEEPDVIEKTVMARVDNDGARAFDKLRTDGVAALSDAERNDWAVFLNSLLERGPDKLAHNDTVAQELAETMIAEVYSKLGSNPEARNRVDSALANLDHEALARNTVRTAMVKEIDATDFVAHVVKQSWCVLRAPKGLELITSDQPLVVNFGDANQRPVDTMSISLSPDELFVCVPPSTQGALTPDDIVLAHSIALLTGSSQFVYARSPVVDGVPVGNKTVNLKTCMTNVFGTTRHAGAKS